MADHYPLELARKTIATTNELLATPDEAWPFGKVRDIAAASHILARGVIQLKSLEEELILACEGALVALVLEPHVDKQQAIDFLREILAKTKGRKAP